MKVLIIGDANKRAAIACVRSLSKKGINIHLAFKNRKNLRDLLLYFNYRKAAGIHQYDPESKEAFVRSLFFIRDRIGPFQVFPIGESLVRWLSEAKHTLLERQITCRVAEPVLYRRLSDKQPFVDLCREYGLPVPRSLPQNELNAFERPFVVKAREGSRGKGVLEFPLLVENKNSFKVFQEKQLDPDLHLFQEYIRGPSIYYCALYNNGNKQLHFSQLNLVQQPDGKSVVRAIPHEETPGELIETIDSMFADLGYDGVMMLELKQNEASNDFVAIECNPRFWGPLQLAIDNGVDFPLGLCGIIRNGAQKESVGYVWRDGYLDGLFLRRLSGTGFQRFRTHSSVKYRDVWLRSDTTFYALAEPLIICLSRALKLK